MKKVSIFNLNVVLLTVAQAEEVSGVMLHYVRALCEEEVLVVDGQETAIAAVMSTLSALITTWPDRNKLLVEGACVLI